MFLAVILGYTTVSTLSDQFPPLPYPFLSLKTCLRSKAHAPAPQTRL